MHGDFSRWFGRIPKNQLGILAQEGRILLDADVNAHALLGARWQDLAARSAFGARVAAIPAENPDAWKVTAATLGQGAVTVSVMPGAAWADGLLVELDAPRGPVPLTATPLQPPVQDPPQDLGAAGTRDAVILEVWRRALNGYQATSDLIEPALGGPDTAERIETAYGLRLYRMGQGETCRSLDLNDQLANHGHLTVTIAPTTMTSGDCPVVQGGGYTGLEHDLYRIEIADVDEGGPAFKWSQWNGGLVGRGSYDAQATKLTLTSGDQAILRSGLTSFYLEALVFDTSVGHWRVQYGLPATLDTNGEIDLSQPARFGSPPDPTMITNLSDPTDTTWFVRIWNGLSPVSDFPAGGAQELRDGIRLAFSGTAFVPGDYWTFPVRAGIDNPPTLLDDAPPFGIHHHRVPLAELHWTSSGATVEDCRIPLHPITATDGCCTHSVGDGILSHGDFTSINAAIKALPGSGGRVCVLPGTYTESVQLVGLTNVEIVGCGVRSQIVAPPPQGETFNSPPAIYVLDSSGIRIESLQVTAGAAGIAMLFEADAAAGTTNPDGGATTPFLEGLHVVDCVVNAGGASGIEIRGGVNVEIRGNRVLVTDQVNEWAAITVDAEGARIERNYIQVIDNKGGEYQALGGIWLRGGCVDIDVIDNEIIGGLAHGVMLGHADQSALTQPGAVFASEIVKGVRAGFVFNKFLPTNCVGCGPGTVALPPPAASGPVFVAGDPLSSIRIRNNSISAMGLAGIGVFGFFPNSDQGIITIDGLEITGNRIFENVTRQLADISSDIAELSGYGAVSLGHVRDVVIRDNEIVRNGNTANAGVCGVYVLWAECAEISRNRIHDNGRSIPQSLIPRGGIWVAFSSSPNPGRLSVAVRENEVDAVNGPALTMGAVGHVQVLANSLSSEDESVATAATVYIENFSLAPNTASTAPTIAGLRAGAVTGVKRDVQLAVGNKPVAARALDAEEFAAGKLKITPAVSGLGVFAVQFTGSVQFCDNCCIYAPSLTAPPVVASVQMQGVSDLMLSGNYFQTNILACVPVTLTGTWVRIVNNRFTDHPNTFTSMLATGAGTIATGNISDHCMRVNGSQTTIDTTNIIIDSAGCPVLQGLAGVLGFASGGQP